MNSALVPVLFGILIAAAVAALVVRDLAAAVFILTAFSFGSALIYALLGAPDIAFIEAVVGAGVSGVYLIAALFLLDRRTKD